MWGLLVASALASGCVTEQEAARRAALEARSRSAERRPARAEAPVADAPSGELAEASSPDPSIGEPATGDPSIGDPSIGAVPERPVPEPPVSEQPAPLAVPAPSPFLRALDANGLPVVGATGRFGVVAGWLVRGRGTGPVAARVAGEGRAVEGVLPLDALTLCSDGAGGAFFAAARAPLEAADLEPGATDPAQGRPREDPFAESFVRNESVTTSGIVDEVGGATEVVLKLRDEDNHFHRIATGPEAFLREASVLPAAGDEVAVEGVRARDASGALIVARTLQRGSSVVQLRDEEGAAAWLAGAREDVADEDTWQPVGELRGVPLFAEDGEVGAVEDLAFAFHDEVVVSVVVPDEFARLWIPARQLEWRDGRLHVDASRAELRRFWAAPTGGPQPR